MQNKIIQIEQDYIQKIHNIEKLYLDDNKIKILKKWKRPKIKQVKK